MKRTPVNDADLLQAWQALTGVELALVAELFGRWPAEPGALPEQFKKPLDLPPEPPDHPTNDPPPLPPPPDTTEPRQTFWRVAEIRRGVDDDAPAEPSVSDTAGGHAEHSVNDAVFCTPVDAVPLAALPLLSVGAVRPRLQRYLLQGRQDRLPDLHAAVRWLAKGRPLHEMPPVRRTRLPRRVQVVVEASAGLGPLRYDFIPVLAALQGWLGPRQRVLRAEASPYGLKNADLRSARVDRDGGPVLVLGDAGLLGHVPEAVERWVHWGQSLVQAGHRPMLLLPASSAVIDPALSRVYDVVAMDASVVAADPHAVDPLRWLRAALFGHTYVRPGLLRRLRQVLQRHEGYGAGLDAAAEARLWCDPAVESNVNACALRPEHRTAAQADFATLPLALREALIETHLDELARMSPLVQAEYALWLSPHVPAGTRLRPRLDQAVQAANQLMAQVASRLDAGQDAMAFDLQSHLLGLRERSADLISRGSDELQRAYVLAWQRQGEAARRADLPPGLRLDKLSALLQPVLGTQLLALHAEVRAETIEWQVMAGDAAAHMPALYRTDGPPVWSLGTALAQGPAPTLQPGDSALWPRAGATSCTIVLGRDRILVEPFARPAWSQAVVFDNGQWFADLPDGRRLTWVPRQTIHVIDGVGADRFTLVHAAWWDLRLPASNPQDDILRSVQNRIDPDSLLRLFISHNHADLEWSRKIQTHLQRQLDYVDSIDCWDDTRISLGEPWQQQIEGAIQRANVAILLLSPDYLASDWVTRVELPKLLERAQNDGVHLFTLVLQPCDFDRHPVLRAFQVVHDPSRALAQMPPLEQDKVLNQLMWQLKGLLSQAMTDRMTAASPWAHPVQAHVPEPMTRPAWAARHGVDEYGYWAEFEVDAQRGPVVQRMRWIAPGEFLMGSPDSEKERYGNERQHRVILTHGYWLAETACTQVMWEAVMGENPSHFKGYPHNPVEQVSWDDVVEKFLPKLNELVPGLKAELPTEAQWEYACRAGVQTPFWFGGQIDTDQVNYCGNYPYTGGQNGEYRKRTVPVKALPSNSWGLYQMHGNVWEWCTDWLSEYPESEVVDPKWSAKPQEQGGHQRVLRGGGWVNNGVYCRSASRDGYHSGAREGFIGFRLARGLADQLASSQPEAGRMRRFK